VALVLGVLGLLAITTSADVLARALATAKQAGGANYFPFTPSIGARLTKNGPDVDVQLVAARGSEAGAEFRILEQGQPLRWVAQAQITIAG
jgi:hypothetical protein